MLKLGTLVVRSWAQFDSAQIKLDTPGITHIRGLNLDDNGNVNGCGKSSLVNSLYAVLFGDHQLAVRKNSLGQVVRDDTRIAVSMHIDGKKIIADLQDGHLKLKVDGRLLDARKKADERNELLRLIPFTPELWSSTVHVNGIASNPLLRGTSAARCQFLERAFDLDRWSNLHQKVGDIIAQMRRADAELTTAKTELDRLGPAIDVGDLRIRAAVLSEKIVKLREFDDGATRALTIREGLPDQPKADVATLQKRLQGLKLEVDGMQAVVTAHAQYEVAYATWRKECQTATATMNEARAALRGPRVLHADRLRHHVDVTTNLIPIAQRNERDGPAITTWKRAAAKMAAKHGIKWDNAHQLRNLSMGWAANFHSGQKHCPVCGSSLKGEVNDSEVAKLKRLVEALPDTLFQVDTSLQSSAELTTLLHKLTLQLEAAESWDTNLTLYKESRGKLARLEEPVKPKGDPTRVSEAAHELTEVRRLLDAAKQWAAADAEAKRNLESLRARRDKIRAKLDESEAELYDINGKLTTADTVNTSRTTLETKITKLEHELTLRPIYKSLQQAYSPNGLRLWLLQELLETIIAGMNDGAHSSRDRKEFGYRLSRNRELTFTAANSKGTFDIRMLSGAESGFFVLNFLSVILPMLPARKRCNTLILDEVDGQMGIQSKKIFASEYLPRLAQTVPSIFVATPSSKQEFKAQGSHEILICKEGGSSRVEIES